MKRGFKKEEFRIYTTSKTYKPRTFSEFSKRLKTVADTIFGGTIDIVRTEQVGDDAVLGLLRIRIDHDEFKVGNYKVEWKREIEYFKIGSSRKHILEKKAKKRKFARMESVISFLKKERAEFLKQLLKYKREAKHLEERHKRRRSR